MYIYIYICICVCIYKYIYIYIYMAVSRLLQVVVYQEMSINTPNRDIYSIGRRTAGYEFASIFFTNDSIIRSYILI